MADLKRCPADIEQSWEDRVESVLGGGCLALETAEERDEARDNKHQPTDVPRLSLPYFGVGLIAEQSDQRGRDSITDLPWEERTGGRLSDHYLLKKEEKVVEPACRGQIIDEVSNPVRPDMQLAHAIIPILSSLAKSSLLSWLHLWYYTITLYGLHRDMNYNNK